MKLHHAAPLALLLLAGTLLPATAHDGMIHDGCPAGQAFTVGDITVSGGFTRATLDGARVGAGYLTVTNAGAAADRLLSATSEIAPTVEIHNMVVKNDVMTMAEVEGGIEIAAGRSVTLAPGGYHIMFIGPNQPFREGECVALTLTFERAGDLPVQLNVGPVGASEAPAHGHH